jgi:hypothetical protein
VLFDIEHQNAVRSQIIRSLMVPNSVPWAHLRVTCKDHKSPIAQRNVHAATNICWSGISQFVKFALTPYVRSQQHIVSDARALVKQLKLLRLPEGPIFVFRIDMKSVFMSGSPEEPAKEASSVFSSASTRSSFGHALLLYYSTSM